MWLFEWARRAARRPVLAPGLARAGLRPDRGRDPPHHRLDGRVRRRGGPDAGEVRRAPSAAGRSSGRGSTACPDHAYPAPNIDWLREMVRWFDRWLKDEPNGADAEPALTWFHRDPTPPERFPKQLEGEWRRHAGLAARRARASHELVALRRRRARRGPAAAGRRRTPSPTSRRPGCAAAPCAGAPATHRTGWPRTCGSRPAPARRTSRRRSPSRSTSSAYRSRRCSSPRPSRSRTSWRGSGAWLPTGRSSRSARRILNLTHRESHERPDAAGARAGVRGPRAAAGRRVPVPGRPPCLPRAGERPLARQLALARSRRAHDPPRRRDAVAAGAAARAGAGGAGSRRRRSGRHASLPEIGSETSEPATLGDRRERRRGPRQHPRGLDDRPAGRHEHPVRRRDHRHGGLEARARHGPVRERLRVPPRRATAAGSSSSPTAPRSPPSRPSTGTSGFASSSMARRSSRGSGARRSPGTCSSRSPPARVPRTYRSNQASIRVMWSIRRSGRPDVKYTCDSSG